MKLPGSGGQCLGQFQNTLFRLCLAKADGFNKLKTPQTSAMVITHYQRLLDYLKPDTVHVLLGGRIVKTGGPELAKEIEARGFDWIKKEASEL